MINLNNFKKWRISTEKHNFKIETFGVTFPNVLCSSAVLIGKKLLSFFKAKIGMDKVQKNKTFK